MYIASGTTTVDDGEAAVFIKESTFAGNRVEGSYSALGGGALSVQGKLLVHNCSFDGNNITNGQGSMVRLAGQGTVQLSFCTFNHAATEVSGMMCCPLALCHSCQACLLILVCAITGS